MRADNDDMKYGWNERLEDLIFSAVGLCAIAAVFILAASAAFTLYLLDSDSERKENEARD